MGKTRILALVLWTCGAVAAAAQDWLSQEFDPAAISDTERRILQSALSLGGDYNGVADGIWGRGSQTALDSYSQREAGHLPVHWADLPRLIAPWQQEMRSGGWGPMDLPGGKVALVPWDLLSPGDGGYSTNSGDLFIAVAEETASSAISAHGSLMDEAAPWTQPYQSSAGGAMTTAVETEDGIRAWMRSEPIAGSGNHTTLAIFAARDEVGRMALIAGSFGQPEATALPQGGLLAEVMAADAGGTVPPPAQGGGGGGGWNPFAGSQGNPGGGPGGGFGGGTSGGSNPFANSRESDPFGRSGGGGGGSTGGGGSGGGFGGGFAGGGTESDPYFRPFTPPEGRSSPARPPNSGTLPAGKPDSTGTGFFIGPDILLTANHVTASCRRITLSDGTPVEVTGADEPLDLAVLSVPETARREAWLPIQPERRARLGEEVFALGFPYMGLLDQGLTVTGGNVSALKGLVDDRIMISAPVQPGNSGGPLLNRRGQVVGVVVSRLDDMVVLEETGSLPQNMNFATPPVQVAEFLERTGITLTTPPMAEIDMTEGLPDEVAEMVVPLLCFQ